MDDQHPRRDQGRPRPRGRPSWRRDGGPARLRGGPAFLRARGTGTGGRDRCVPWPSTLLLSVLVVLGSVFAGRHQHRVGLDAYAVLLLLAGPALLLLRRRHPVVAVYGVVVTALVYLGAGYPYGPVFVSVVVAVFAAIAAGHRYAAWWAVGLLWAGHLLLAHWLYRWLPPAGDHAAPWGQEVVVAAWVVAVCAAAELLRLRRERWAREAAEREAAERRRRDEERMRIARELHDVLAHSISVINVQAGVGLALLDADPEQARSALTTIKAASKEALGEVRQVLDTLRTPGDAPRAPAPGLDRLPELVEQAAAAGLAVEVRREGEPVPLPPGADLAAFRIIQEALTNVVRHSGSRTARITLAYERGAGRDADQDPEAGSRAPARRAPGAPGLLRLRIDDAGPATRGNAGGGGNGLVGMRERTAALGGTIEAGPDPDGGFRVHATIPLTPEETP
ncbi:sensor histidine kinase [Streptomyces liangshanensis]|uniref:histidine kinase n=1 Tax=Streptomyces liangshanensis TaxID=2717324 RepID=A0A6G9H6Q8_9ACTN|nr:sensor histidine kinase [Streptomyces liangshanensis]QIQ06238.1 sensor histidine kinase [Streptomyces liangshanensis]